MQHETTQQVNAEDKTESPEKQQECDILLDVSK